MLNRVPSKARPFIVLAVAIALAFPAILEARKKVRSGSSARPANPDELRIVDCLLPGQMRKLGRSQSFVTARRPIKTTEVDCAIRGGEYVAYDRANYATALKVWLAAADSGDAEAQYYVGEIYEKGLGIEPQYEQAAAWYRKSAEQGYSRAQINLGFLYEQGLGVEQDPRQALEWYRRASDLPYVMVLDSELGALQQELATTTARLETEQAAVRKLEAQLEARSVELKAERASAEGSTQRGNDLEQQVKFLQQQIKTRSTEVAALGEQQKETAKNVAGPDIEVFDPSTLRSRGIRDEGGTSRRNLVGRVTAAAGLDSFSVGGRVQSVDDRGLFEVSIPEAESRSVRLVAIDRLGTRAEVEYRFGEPGGVPGGPVRPANDVSRRGLNLGPSHALVIGNDDYESLPRLETATRDARAIAALLEEQYGFEVRLLLNATRYEILSAFRTLSEELTAKDDLLVYYAGHGELDRAEGRGYWLPVDADPARKQNWVSSSEISDYLAYLKAKHVLVVADSCYSGALTRSSLAHFDEGAAGANRAAWLKQMARNRSRTALTSGGLKPVLDSGGGEHSVFARAILDVLDENSGVLETQRLWSAVAARVAYATETLHREQTPEYAPIHHAGHESGEFFFVPTPG